MPVVSVTMLKPIAVHNIGYCSLATMTLADSDSICSLSHRCQSVSVAWYVA
jgi:hypothetical protein